MQSAYKNRIPALDGFRAVSLIMIFIAHSGVGYGGRLAVNIFFFISGYIITTLLRKEIAKTDSIDIVKFYYRRALRLFPPFLIVMAVAGLLTAVGVLTKQVTVAGITAQILYLTNYWIILFDSEGILESTGHFWTLSVEEHFYLLFPLLYLFLAKRFTANQVALALVFICAVILGWRL